MVAVDDVSFDVGPGRLVALVGPNGAGKTTVIDAISGVVPSSGNIVLNGVRIDGLAAHRRARLGLRRTFGALALFEDLTVAENLAVAIGRSGRVRSSPGDGDAGPADGSDWLERLGLSDVADELPGGLSHVRRGLVSLGRALASNPGVVLLDEPAAGLDNDGRASLGTRLRALVDAGMAIVLVEHDLDLVSAISDEVVVLDRGRVIAAGSPAEVRRDSGVQAAYFGNRTPIVGPTDVQVRWPRAAGSVGSPRSLSPALEVTGLTAGYGGAPAIRNLSLVVARGEVVVLLGINGVGKTTALASIAGTLRRMSGQVLLDGALAPALPHRVARHGLAYVPAGPSLFGDLTVAENLRLALGPRSQAGRGRSQWQLPPGFSMLEALMDRRAGLLSGGEARAVALARAIMRRPSVLLVDELSLGLAPALAADLLGRLRTLADLAGTAVLLVEQHAHLALAVADRAYALVRGEISAGGPAREFDLRTQAQGWYQREPIDLPCSPPAIDPSPSPGT